MAPPPDQPIPDPPSPQPEDLGALMVEYGPALRRYFSKKVSPSDADDLVQDVFLAMQTRGSGRPVDNIRRYLFTVAANVLARRNRDTDAFDPLLESLEPTDDLSPERQVASRQALARLIVAVDNLAPRCRTAFMLHRFEDMTYRAIAERMNIGTDAVKQLLQRAMVRLAEDMRQAR